MRTDSYAGVAYVVTCLGVAVVDTSTCAIRSSIWLHFHDDGPRGKSLFSAIASALMRCTLDYGESNRSDYPGHPVSWKSAL